MMRTLTLLAGVGLLLGAGFLHGRWTDRQYSATELKDAADRLTQLPRTIGDWRGGEDKPLEARVLKASGAEGILLRSYVNQQSHAQIDVLLVCGRPGPVAVHTPDVCYQGAGNEVGKAIGLRVETGADQPAAEFKMVGVKTGGGKANPAELEVLWSWNADGRWLTPTFPRLKFAAYPILYKLYVIRTLGDAEVKGNDMSVKFLELLLPEVQRSVLLRQARDAARPEARADESLALLPSA
jgi:Protein of unknown function (DUF3485)